MKYIIYKNAFRSPFASQKYDIKLFPLGYPNILEDIEKVKDKENTILLLDAFDELFGISEQLVQFPRIRGN